MTLFALASATGAPGVTSLTCALGAIWPTERAAVVAECDPSGGDLAARFALLPDMGLVGLTLASRPDRDGPMALEDAHSQQLPGGLEVLCGPVGADAAWLLDRELSAVGLEQLARRRDVLADCGRIGAHFAGQHRLLSEADSVLLVVAAEASSLAAARWAVERIATLRSASRDTIGLVVRQPGVFGAEDMAAALDVSLAGVLPTDHSAASILRGEPGARRGLARSTFISAARRIAGSLNRPALEGQVSDAS